MAVDLTQLVRSTTNMPPPSILLYGVQGIGKTSFGAGAPNPIFLAFEDGTASVDVQVTPVLRTFGEAMEWLHVLRTTDHTFRTVVADSLDWFEPLVWKATCEANGWANIETPGFGKGYVAALDFWRQWIDALDKLRRERGMAVIQIAHSQIKKFDNPETESYDRYEIKLQPRASALMLENADAVLFANYLVGTSTTGKNPQQLRTRAVGASERVIYTQERPGFLAKSRYGHPEKFDFPSGKAGWAQFMATMNTKEK